MALHSGVEKISNFQFWVDMLCLSNVGATGGLRPISTRSRVFVGPLRTALIP
jgi:hypothetical protein